MDFKNSFSTNRLQFLKLCSLGIKRDTADMSGYIFGGEPVVGSVSKHERENPQIYENDRDWPAWSLGRLIEMCPKSITIKDEDYGFILEGDGWCGYYEVNSYDGLVMRKTFDCGDVFDNLILCIEWLISIGQFNKEYLTGDGYDYALCVLNYEKKIIEDGSFKEIYKKRLDLKVFDMDAKGLEN